MRRFVVARRGSAAIEFALLGGSFILLMLFLVEISMVLWTRSALQTAALQTARCTAITSPLCPDPQGYVTALLDRWGVATLAGTPGVTVQASISCNNATGQFSRVTITARAGGIQSFLPPLSGITLSASACYPSAS